MASQEETAMATAPVSLTFKYSDRVLLKTILERPDGGLGLVGERVIVGGWVKSSKELKKDPVVLPRIAEGRGGGDLASGSKDKNKDVSCVEILQSRIPFFRTIIRVLVGGGGSGSNSPLHEKFESIVSKPPSTAFIQVSDGSCVPSLQVVVDSAIASPSKLLPTGTCILVEGVLEQPPAQGKHTVQLRAENLIHIGPVDQVKYPLTKKRLPLDSLRAFSHFRQRTTTVASVMRIRSALTFASHAFFRDNGFLYVQVPIITTTDGEGFSEKFHVTTLFSEANKVGKWNTTDSEGVSLDVVRAAMREKSSLVEELKRSESNKEALAAAVKDLQKTNVLAEQLKAKEKFKKQPSVETNKFNFSEDFFSAQTYLTVSGCLHLESYACALGNVYSFGPRFRAEKNESVKHVAEMWMVEVEMAFSLLQDAINCADDYFKFLCKWILENCSEDVEFVTKRIDKDIINRLQSIISTSFEKMTYTEALKILEEVTDKTSLTKLEWGVALTQEHLSYLVDEICNKPLIIYDYPKALKPFYVRLNDDGKTVAAFDMIVPKVGALITGSQNEERVDMLNTRIKELGLPKEQYEWYLDLRRNGTVKHSGFSLGFDLMVLFCTGLTDVKDVIPFPRSLGKANN